VRRVRERFRRRFPRDRIALFKTRKGRRDDGAAERRQMSENYFKKRKKLDVRNVPPIV